MQPIVYGREDEHQDYEIQLATKCYTQGRVQGLRRGVVVEGRSEQYSHNKIVDRSHEQDSEYGPEAHGSSEGEA